MPRPLIERRVRLAGFLIGMGLLTQLVTFLWIHPLAFMAFLLLGCPLVGAGILLYLYSLVSTESSHSSDDGSPRSQVGSH